MTDAATLVAGGPDGERVIALVLQATKDGDLPVSSAVIDLVLAAAAIVTAVRAVDPSANPCPPPEGSAELQVAVQAVSNLATSMLGMVPEVPS